MNESTWNENYDGPDIKKSWPEYIEPSRQKIDVLTPAESHAFDTALSIVDIFEENDGNPSIHHIEKKAWALFRATNGATGATENVRVALQHALESQKRCYRAVEVKAAALHLAEMVLENPSLDTPVPDDSLPF